MQLVLSPLLTPFQTPLRSPLQSLIQPLLLQWSLPLWKPLRRVQSLLQLPLLQTLPLTMTPWSGHGRPMPA